MLDPVYMDWAPDEYTASIATANTGDDQMIPWCTSTLCNPSVYLWVLTVYNALYANTFA